MKTLYAIFHLDRSTERQTYQFRDTRAPLIGNMD
jgi:hypothetical protein